MDVSQENGTKDTIKIALLDDNLKPLTINDIQDTNLVDLILTPTTNEHSFVINYSIDNNKTPEGFSSDDPDQVDEFLSSETFYKEVIITRDFQKAASEAHPNLVIDDISIELIQDIEVFKNIYEAFSDSKYEITQLHERPRGVDLKGYNLILMDLMMQDEIKSTEEIADYIGEIVKFSDEKSFPSFILMSSHPEINENRATIREKAKLSSLGFTILHKSEISNINGDKRLSLISSQMFDNKKISYQLSNLFKCFEKSLSEAWLKTSQNIWNLDAAFLQYIHRNTSHENYAFEDHLLEAICKHHLWHVESCDETIKAIKSLAASFETKKAPYASFQSYSKESPFAAHDLAAKNMFIGSTKSAPHRIESHKCDDDTLSTYLPFGALLVEGNKLEDGKRCLIHCSQLCDLSRNIFKHDMSLVFIEATIHKNQPYTAFGKTNPRFVIPIPSNNPEELWSAHINLKKVVSRPAKEMIFYLEQNCWYTINYVRADVVRQIRQESFQQLSRIEANVSSSNASNHAKCLIRVKTDKEVNDHWYNSSSNTQQDAQPINLTKFIDYHLIGPESLELSIWLNQVLETEGFNHIPKIEEIENSLRSKLGRDHKAKDVIKEIKIIVSPEIPKQANCLSKGNAMIILIIE
ncbi:hypothetical protein ACFVYJ_10995 [Pontibacter sp. JAM-7]|uniref:hypothetical protein n=1 Tax=Pontibacter sp. JAM-7 TaxID=3366581 RepID=UPI003AF448E7